MKTTALSHSAIVTKSFLRISLSILEYYRGGLKGYDHGLHSRYAILDAVNMEMRVLGLTTMSPSLDTQDAGKDYHILEKEIVARLAIILTKLGQMETSSLET